MEWLSTHIHQFESLLEISQNPKYPFYLRVPDEVVEEMGGGRSIRTRGTMNDEPFELAVLPEGEGFYLIRMAKFRVKALKLEPGDHVEVKLQLDNSEYGMALPADLAELFEFAPDVKAAFDQQLTPFFQRNAIYTIKAAKSPETRAKRIADLLNRLGIAGF